MRRPHLFSDHLDSMRLPGALAAGLVCAAAWLLAAAPAVTGDKVHELVLHPDVEGLHEAQGDGEQAVLPFEIDGDVVRLELGGVLIQVRPLTEAKRRSWFQVRSRLGVDPFPTVQKFPEGFLVFEVSFLNNTSEEFQFLPGMASIIRGRKGKGRKELFAMSIGDLYSYFDTLFAGNQEQITKAMEALYFNTLYLAPGERTSKLLVFHGLSHRTKRVGLNLDFLFLGAESQDVLIPYLAEAIER